MSEGVTVTLDGSASSDPDGDTISYSWTASSGITLSGANTATPSFTAPDVTSNTAYTLTLTVSDGSLSDTDTVTVTVRHVNRAPTANAGADQSVPEGATVNLDGSSSSDPDGDTLTYSWTVSPSVTLQNANTATPSFTAPAVTSDTDYTLTLTVSDGSLSRTDTVVVTVRDINRAPTANAGADQTVDEGATVSLSGSSSSDPDGDTISYSWTAPSGITLSGASTATPSFTAPEVTSDTAYTITLNVTDGALHDTDTVTVTVRHVNRAPTADAGADQSVSEGATVSLDGSSSSDPDGDALTYSWTAPAAITLSGATTATPSFTAPEASADTTYVFTLTVSDGSLSDTDAANVTVRDVPPPPANSPPVASAGPDQTVDEGSLVQLNGSASSDPDGDSISYSWRLNQWGTNEPIPSLSGATTATPSFTAPQVTGDAFGNAYYWFALTVSDGFLSATDYVSVIVRDVPPPNQAPTAIMTLSSQNIVINSIIPAPLVTANCSASTDPEGDMLTYSWSSDPSISGVDGSSSSITFKPSRGASYTTTTYTITCTVSDGTNTNSTSKILSVYSGGSGGLGG